MIRDVTWRTIERLLPLAQVSPVIRLHVQVPGVRRDPVSRSHVLIGEIDVKFCSLHPMTDTLMEARMGVLHYRILRGRADIALRFVHPSWTDDDVDFSAWVDDDADWSAGLSATSAALERKLPLALAWPLALTGGFSLTEH